MFECGNQPPDICPAELLFIPSVTSTRGVECQGNHGYNSLVNSDGRDDRPNNHQGHHVVEPKHHLCQACLFVSSAFHTIPTHHNPLNYRIMSSHPKTRRIGLVTAENRPGLCPSSQGRLVSSYTATENKEHKKTRLTRTVSLPLLESSSLQFNHEVQDQALNPLE